MDLNFLDFEQPIAELEAKIKNSVMLSLIMRLIFLAL